MKHTTILLLLLGYVAVLTTGIHAQEGLPTLVITTSGPLNAQEKVDAHLTTKGYDSPIGIKLRGNSSLAFNQKKYTFETRDGNGKSLSVSLLGMPAHSDWVLLAPYNDVSMLRDPLAFKLWRDMGHWGPRTVMCELTMDGDYRGIYILCEAIKRGKNRVDISEMKASDTNGRALTGGYLLRIDTFNDDDATFTSKVPGIGEGSMSSEVIWSCIYPKKKKLQPEQLDYIQRYVDTVEQVIQSDSFADPTKGYACYIDVPSFVDYFIHTELSLNADGYKRSAYFYKERQKKNGSGGKLVAGPVWDYNLAYGNCNFANANNPEAWCYEGASNNPTPAIWQRLLQDITFRRAVKTRYQELRQTVLSDQAINDFIDRQVQLLAQATDRHFKTYPELLVSEERKQQLDQQNQANPFGAFPMGAFPMGAFPPQGDFPPTDSIIPPFGVFPMGEFPMGAFLPQGAGFPPMGNITFDATGMFAAYRVSSYDEEIATLKQWLANRLAFLDRNIARFDTDWQPRIQPLVEKKLPFPFVQVKN
ncbi:MAG: CotH kinase family protein [Bacteroidaceae bacterium]|nr:CotH kinase family protein [Bacteroidaceae bacterium]